MLSCTHVHAHTHTPHVTKWPVWDRQTHIFVVNDDLLLTLCLVGTNMLTYTPVTAPIAGHTAMTTAIKQAKRHDKSKHKTAKNIYIY